MNHIEFAFNYSKLVPTEREIIEFLYKITDNIFIGGYSDLMKAMTKPVYNNVSNFRKAIIRLSERNIVLISYKKNRRIDSIQLNPYWEAYI